ncbi:MSMEG_0570 family nitrogen starvation response protein [Streptosporangium sp. NPDC023963]|uniref:MSMEG_0570 family nitrogen starvation response protein n=1 Tax=Streptosporangium sp. NPDC023963 TaxID=3155608 RepID=UPI003412220C
MPEMYFQVRWPDGSRQRCYSPSLVIEDFLHPEQSYPIAEFVSLSSKALEAAGRRVREKYGFGCTAAAGQLAEIERKAAGFAGAGMVTVERFER